MMGRKKNWLVWLIINSLRVVCFIVFFHWIVWATTYANCTNYRDSINKSIEQNKNLPQEEIEYGYQKWGKREKKTIEQIEEDILSKIEAKKGVKQLPREWKTKQLPELTSLYEEKAALSKKENLSEAEKKALEKKEQTYQDKLKTAKEKTIENIQQQLKNNELIISELDDGRSGWESLTNDPLNFFLLTPLNKTSKGLGLTESLWGEIIFKLIIVKLLYILVMFPQATLATMQENAEKLNNPYLSMEEKEQISQEFAPLGKFLIFNLTMWLLFMTFIFIHPSFVERSNPQFYKSTTFLFWFTPIIFASLLASISSEFLRQGRILKWGGIKNYLVKNWVGVFIIGPLGFFLISFILGNFRGTYILIFLSIMVEFAINMIRVIFFRHKRRGVSRHSTGGGFGFRRRNY